MDMGIEAAPRHGRHPALEGQVLRCLKPHPGLLIAPNLTPSAYQ